MPVDALAKDTGYIKDRVLEYLEKRYACLYVSGMSFDDAVDALAKDPERIKDLAFWDIFDKHIKAFIGTGMSFDDAWDAAIEVETPTH